MINLCIVHNQEADRLKYLEPKIEDLKLALRKAGHDAIYHSIGPEVSGMRTRVASNTRVNQIRRAIDHSRTSFGCHWHNPDKSIVDVARCAPELRREFKYMLSDYNRSIEIEQEVFYAHAECWKIGAEPSADITVVLESDARFNANSKSNLLAAIDYVLALGDRLVYFDLAGGFDPRILPTAWCFESRLGCKSISVPGTENVEIFQTAAFFNNTVAGYMLNRTLARTFSKLMKRPPMLAPDWGMMLWAWNNSTIRKCACIHSIPTILSHGSQEGDYISSIEPK